MNDNGDGFFATVGSNTVCIGGRPAAHQPAYPPLRRSGANPDAAVVGCWAQRDNLFYGISRAHDAIPPGVYLATFVEGIGPCLAQLTISTDELIALPDSQSAAILDDIRRFRSRGDRFRALGFLHKKGVLLWGPPGSGKTATIHQLCELIVGQEGGIAVYVDNPGLASACLQMVRRIEPDRPILAIIEEIEQKVRAYDAAEYLALLDGELQVDNLTWCATTNYPENLDARFVDRPGRFSMIRYVGMPGEAARRAYVEHKLLRADTDAGAPYMELFDRLVAISDGLSIDHLRELIVLTQCDDVPIEDAATRVRAMRTQRPRSDRTPDQWQGVGFGAGGLIEEMERERTAVNSTRGGER